MKTPIRCIRAVLKRFGSNQMKSKTWNREFSKGHWDYLMGTDSTNDSNRNLGRDYIEKYCDQGSILDLGCGWGNTGLELSENKYRYYKGVDISDVAIQKAASMCQSDNVRKSKNDFVVGDVSKYTPDRKYDVILFKESLCYINRFCRKKVLNNYTRYLEKNGVVIVIMVDKERFQNIPNMICKNFRVIEKYVPEEKYVPGGSEPLVLVFK